MKSVYRSPLINENTLYTWPRDWMGEIINVMQIYWCSYEDRLQWFKENTWKETLIDLKTVFFVSIVPWLSCYLCKFIFICIQCAIYSELLRWICPFLGVLLFKYCWFGEGGRLNVLGFFSDDFSSSNDAWLIRCWRVR